MLLPSRVVWLDVINLYITWDGDVTKVWVHVGSVFSFAEAPVYLDIPAYKIARRTTVELWLRGSTYTVFELLVNCLGGPLIDTWDSDLILSPVSDVWQPTPSLLITSFTQATGLLCLGPHTAAFPYSFSYTAQSVFFYTPIVVVLEHLLCCIQLLTPSIFCSWIWTNLWCSGDEWQLIDSASSSPFGSGRYMSPQQSTWSHAGN